MKKADYYAGMSEIETKYFPISDCNESTVEMTVYYYHVTYDFESESALGWVFVYELSVCGNAWCEIKSSELSSK